MVGLLYFEKVLVGSKKLIFTDLSKFESLVRTLLKTPQLHYKDHTLNIV
jgi:hypothetical protein